MHLPWNLFSDLPLHPLTDFIILVMSLGRWLLVCWGPEGRSVVNVRSVVEGQELKVGDDVTVTSRRGGATRTGKLLMASDDRKLLEKQIVSAPPNSEQLPGPNLYEEPLGDFSPSESDWGPESANSSDSDAQEEESKKIKLESVKRQYSNKGVKKSRTPALRAEAVIPLSRKATNLRQSQLNFQTNSWKQSMDSRKSTPVRQAVPDSTRGQYPNARSPSYNGHKAATTVSTYELLKVKKDISEFKEMLSTIKKSVASIKSAVSSDHLYETKYASMPRSHVTNLITPEANDDNGFVEVAIDLPVETAINNTPEPEMDAMNVSRASSNMQDYKPIRYGLIKHNNGRKRSPIEKASDLSKNVPLVCMRNKTKNTPKMYSGKKKRPSKVENGANTSGASDTIPEHCDDMVPIGSGKTFVPSYVYSKINWDSYTMATRKLLMAVFPRRTLATHSLTGKQSPAFTDKPAKLCLDPKKVFDIVITVTKNCHVKESLVRSAITTKCADEYKMLRMKSSKNKSKRSSLNNVSFRILNNQENLPPEESYNQTM